MRNAWAVAKREFFSYFTTPIGYIVVGTFALITGLAFANSLLDFAHISQSPAELGYESIPDFEEFALSPFLVFCGQMILFIGPLITMRLLAEERNRGTLELLMTYPLRDGEIVAGKYFAALGMLVVLMAVVGVHMEIVGSLTEVEPAVLGFGLVTVFLMGAAFMSMGLFVSAVTRNQITAATVTFALWFASWILGRTGVQLPEAIETPERWPEWAAGAVTAVYGFFRSAVLELPLDAHAEDMAQGIVQPKDIAYYLLFSAFFLFLTFRALEARRWKA